MLTPDVQLCLAHACEIHGPTPLMVTEGLPVPCSSCFGYDVPSYLAESRRPSATAQTVIPEAQSSTALNDALRRMNLTEMQRNPSQPLSGDEAQARRTMLRRTNQLNLTPINDVETPPLSPRRVPDAHKSTMPAPPMPHRRDSNFNRTYDDYTKKRATACDNCAMSLPKRQDSKVNNSATSDPASPTLRTRVPHAKVYGSTGEASPPASQTASSSDTEENDRPRQFAHRRTGTATSTTSRSSASSMSQRSSHTHYLDYTSTHEPVESNSFSVIRASCLRTLFYETLPRDPKAPPLVSPQTPSFVTTQTSGIATSGGSIFFGDSGAGFTTAYIFRIPDIHARGHKRIYAFIALSTQRERVAMKTFGYLSAAFQELASWVQKLAEAEADRAASESSATNSPIVPNMSQGSNFTSPPPPTPVRDQSSGGSSFLSGGGGLSRRMGTGYAPNTTIKARGLPELCGMPDFFIELHARFVRLLLELGVIINS